MSDLRATCDGLRALLLAAELPGPLTAGRKDMQSYDAYTGEAFTNVYADVPDGKWHMGSRLPQVVARGFEPANKARAALIVAAINALPALLDALAPPRSVDVRERA